MNAVQLENNYYTVIDGVNVYVDYYSSRLKIVDNAKISKSAIQEIINFARKENLNAEITDCAIYENFRGRGLLSSLIIELEKDLKAKGFITAYSLCRAINPGINAVLNKLDYKYCGKLIKNCYICGSFEDMNIWAKSLIHE